MQRAIPDVFDDLEIGITIHDPETGEVLGVNERLEDLYGYTAAELREMGVADYSAEDEGFTQAEAERRIRAAAAGEPQTFEWHVERGDGSLVWVRVRLAETTLNGESVVIAEISDITERKEREQELQEERAFSESLIEAVPDVFYAFDETGQFYEWNERLSEVSGYTDEEIAEMTPQEFFPEDQRDKIDEVITEVIQTESPIRVESEYLTKDGGRIPHEFSGGPLYDAEGNFSGVAGIGRDITERKERERKLRKQQETLDHISENINDVIWISSPGKDEMDFVSAAYEDIWGHSVEELYDRPVSFVEAIHEEDREDVLDALDSQQTDPESYEETYRVVQPDGESRWVHDRAFGVRNEDGQLERIVGVASDVTRHKEYEDRLERSNQRLQQFAYILSHDLQEPLRMVASYVDLLEAELDDELDEETREYMEFAADGADRMQAMIDDLLQYSRVGTRGGDFEETDVAAVLEDVMRDLELTLEENEIEVVVDDLPTVRADTSQLGQLFQNLLKNAADHGGAGTTVEITAEETGNGYVFSVTDDGPGIPEEQQDAIFDIFEKGGESDGPGIGLAVCERIVNRHEGDIHVESTPGEGTTFRFTLDPPAATGS